MPWAEVTSSEEKLLPGSFPREQCRVTEDFPTSDLQDKTVATAGLHPTQLSLLSAYPPHATSYPHVVPHRCSSHNCHCRLLPKNASPGLRFCPVTESQPKLLHLASQARWCKPLQHTARTALELTAHNHRNSADFPPVPRPQCC